MTPRLKLLKAQLSRLSALQAASPLLNISDDDALEVVSRRARYIYRRIGTHDPRVDDPKLLKFNHVQRLTYQALENFRLINWPSHSIRLVYLNIMGRSFIPALTNEVFFFGLNREPRKLEDMDLIDQVLVEAGLESRGREFVWRVGAEADLRLSQGWYSIFWTLTFSSKYDASAVLSDAIKEFRLKLQRLTCKTVYGFVDGSRHGIPINDYFTYACVVERHKSGVPHLHLITFHRDLPLSWKRDPNKGRRIPNYREISAAKSLWTFGFTSPMIFRTDASDPWGKLGHIWPVSKGKPLSFTDAFAAGKYIGKYASKSKGDMPWRRKMTRGLGLTALKQLLHHQPPDMLRILSRTLIHLPIEQRPSTAPPLSLIRSLCRQTRHSRLTASGRASTLFRIRLSRIYAPNRNDFLATLQRQALKSGVKCVSLPIFYKLLHEISAEAPSEMVAFLQQYFRDANRPKKGVIGQTLGYSHAAV